jgi:hypothetical protein
VSKSNTPHIDLVGRQGKVDMTGNVSAAFGQDRTFLNLTMVTVGELDLLVSLFLMHFLSFLF